MRPALRHALGIPGRRPVVYQPEALAFFARLTTAPTRKRMRAYNDLIVALKQCGALAVCDGFYVIGADEQAFTRNLVGDIYNLTAVNAPTYAADNYVAGNGTTSYYDTGANPTTMVSPKFVQDSAHLGIWSLTNNNNAGALSYDAGNANTFIARTAATSGGVTFRVNRTGSALATLPGYPGHIVVSRSASDLFKIWGNGTDIGGATTASTGVSNQTLRISDASGSLHGVNQIRAMHFGSHMTLAQAAAVNAALRAYASAIGAP